MKKLFPRTLEFVKEALRNANDNGHTFNGWTDTDVAGDLIAYDDTFAQWSVKRLTPYVTAARK